MLEIESTLTEMTNTFNELISKLNIVEETNVELEDIAI